MASHGAFKEAKSLVVRAAALAPGDPMPYRLMAVFHEASDDTAALVALAERLGKKGIDATSSTKRVREINRSFAGLPNPKDKARPLHEGATNRSALAARCVALEKNVMGSAERLTTPVFYDIGRSQCSRSVLGRCGKTCR